MQIDSELLEIRNDEPFRPTGDRANCSASGFGTTVGLSIEYHPPGVDVAVPVGQCANVDRRKLRVPCWQWPA